MIWHFYVVEKNALTACIIRTMLFDVAVRYKTWASCQIRKIAACACTGNARNVFPRRRLQRKPLISEPDMHHGTIITHVPWCMSRSLTCGGGENVPGAYAPAIWRIWQDVHWVDRFIMWHNGYCWIGFLYILFDMLIKLIKLYILVDIIY